jgi:pterin-4a-carbinolamine dehydratase
MNMRTWIFISYRRDDSWEEALLIKKDLIKEFGGEAVFFDTDIHLGNVWPEEIPKTLEQCAVVLAIIGPTWVKSPANEWGQRRIDCESDWVRKELKLALDLQEKPKNPKLLPIYVNGARKPPATALPSSLQSLLAHQAIEIRRNFWDHDIQLVLAEVHQHRPPELRRDGDKSSPYPVMTSGKPPKPYDEREMNDVIIENRLTSWAMVRSQLPQDSSRTRIELHKKFEFSEFLDVIRFMQEVAPGCEILNHHPRWDNIYKTLNVYLSTWAEDIHNITDRDVQLAKYLDEVYSRYLARIAP